MKPVDASTISGGRQTGETLIVDNRKAFHDYHILETFEAGVMLLDTEVKGVREGKANPARCVRTRREGEAWLYNVHINPYSHRGYVDHDPKRRRKLLLHRQEIRKRIGKPWSEASRWCRRGCTSRTGR